MSTSEEWANSDSSIHTNQPTNKSHHRDPFNFYISPHTSYNNAKLSSPLTSRNLKNCLSFASIKHHKIANDIQQTPKNSVKKYQNVLENVSGVENLLKGKTKSPLIQKLKNGGHAAEDQSSKIVLESYRMQAESLKETVCILKEQITALSSNNKILKQQNRNLQQQKQTQSQQLAQTLAQLHRHRKKQSEYQSIIPKIEELEDLQDTMIEENTKVKERQMLLRELLAEIVVLVGGKQDEVSVGVRQAIARKLGD